MEQFLPRAIKAKSERGLRLQLRKIQAKRGKFLQVINIYPKGNEVICWFYDEPLNEEDLDELK